MIIDDERALREWLVATLEPLCDAEPIALARYVLALVAKDKPLDKLHENCIDRLEVFLDRATKDFVDQLFDVIRNRSYIPEGKKENVQPIPSESDTISPDINQQQTDLSPTKQENSQQIESSSIPTTSSTNVQPIKRRYSSRNQSNVNTDSHKRQSTGSPPAKRTQRSYSHSSIESSPPPTSAINPDFSMNKIPCKDFFDNKGYCALGDSCPYDHGSQIWTLGQANYYPSYQQYNPETPDLKYDPHQTSSMYQRPTMPIGQRTLVTVVTNAEPLTSEQKSRQNDSNGSMVRTKRHVTTTSYPIDRRTQQQRDSQSNNNQDNHHHHHHQRPRKRPWQKPDGTGTGSTTLEIRKIPIESNTISKLNEHFSKFGTVTNVQISFDGSPDSALVAYGTFQEAETAYKNPEPLFNNRFIKIFWHNPNKVNSTNSANSNPSSTDGSSVKKATTTTTTSNPIKHHWTKVQKSSTDKPQIPIKRKSIVTSTIKKEAAKKASIEIRRKKQNLLDEQIQQQKLLLKKLETAETNEEKESIRSLMKQVDSKIVELKDSFRTIPVKSSSTTSPKVSQQDILKQREATLKKQIETLRAKTSADMRRAISNTIENKISDQNRTNDNDNEKNQDQQIELETHDETELLES